MYSVHKVFSLDDDWGTNTHFTPESFMTTRTVLWVFDTCI
jgi:hypothetical protein